MLFTSRTVQIALFTANFAVFVLILAACTSGALLSALRDCKTASGTVRAAMHARCVFVAASSACLAHPTVVKSASVTEVPDTARVVAGAACLSASTRAEVTCCARYASMRTCVRLRTAWVTAFAFGSANSILVLACVAAGTFSLTSKSLVPTTCAWLACVAIARNGLEPAWSAVAAKTIRACCGCKCLLLTIITTC